jgi:hypothetical protein
MGKLVVIPKELSTQQARELVDSIGKGFGLATSMSESVWEEVVDEYLYLHLEIRPIKEASPLVFSIPLS